MEMGVMSDRREGKLDRDKALLLGAHHLEILGLTAGELQEGLVLDGLDLLRVQAKAESEGVSERA